MRIGKLHVTWNPTKPRYRLCVLAEFTDVSWWYKTDDPNVPVELIRCTSNGFKRF